jgi:hypothetical protein
MVFDVHASVRLVPALALTLALLSSSYPAAIEADPLAAAKAAYVATEYEEALKLLSSPALASDDADMYRALCLLALGRMNEVDGILRALVVRNPSYRMSEHDVTPRMIAIFQEVRARTLLAMIKEAYADAKAVFDAGRFADASSRFSSVLGLIDREAASLERDAPAARDVAQLARGFRELADAEVAKAAAAAASESTGSLVSAMPALPVAAREEIVIGNVVERYALAYSALDASAVTRVYPAESGNTLRAAFSRLKSQSIQARDLDIALDADGRTATVKLLWVVQAVPRVGNTVKAQRPTTLRMSRTDAGDWTIVERR